MKSAPFVLCSCAFMALATLHADVAYIPITDTSIIVTGVRSDSSSSDSVVISASKTTTGSDTVAALYEGSLAGAASTASWYSLNPTFAGQTVNSSTFYGPNTSLYDPSLGAGNVRVVGSYKYSESTSGSNADHGMMYQGAVTGGGTWTQLDATPLVTNGSLINTIAHSTMGSLVVGNYDTSLSTGHAFIYNVANQTWLNLNPANSASVTAYGIWQNGGSSSTSYTIAGGFSDLNSGGIDEGYLVNYDSASNSFSNFKAYNFNNQPISSLISHFDGITATSNGFNLTGDYLAGGTNGAFFASVSVLGDGSFSDASWRDIAYPIASVTSGNTVISNSVLGIFVNGGTQSYIAAVPEPSTAQLFLSALALLLLGVSTRRKVN